MSPPSSFGDLFSSSGRLRRQWKAALAETDPHSGLARLRELRVAMEKRPEAAAEIWIGFLRSTVGPPYGQLLTEADFEALEILGGRVAQAAGIPLDQAVRPLAAGRLGRGEALPADELLTRLYWAEGVQDAARAVLADELARSGRRDAPRIEVYADLLGRAGPRPPAVLELVADATRVDFSSDPEQLRQAASLAAAGLPGADRAAGLHRLLVTGELDLAGDSFLAALAADPHDETALLGLLITYVRAGQAVGIPGPILDAARTAAPGVAATAELARTLAWFDQDTDQPPPSSAARLGALGLPREAGPWLDYARGRLFLLEGAAARARALLLPLAKDDSSVPEWRYHAAWSLLLTGDRAGLWSLTERMTRDPDDWALASLLLDAEPHAVTGTDAEHAAAAVPPGYEPIARVRRDLAAGIRTPGTPGPPPSEGGGAPRRLEALRTVLAAAYGRAAREADMAASLREPLYRRLPRADRLLWSGLLVLRGEPEEGRRLLEAALALGHERAALVLAAHHLEERRPARALRLLAGLNGEKAELLRTWAEAVGGAGDDVVEEGLGRLTAHRSPQASYALGAIRLLRIAGEGSTLEREDTPYHARQAARDLDRAMATEPDAVPPDTAVLLRAARTAAHATAVAPGDGPTVPAPSVQQHPWAEWVLGLARLADDPEAADVELCRRLASLVEEADEPSPRAVTALAGLLAAAGMLSKVPYRRDAIARLVRSLAERHPLPEVDTLADRVMAAAMALPAPGRPSVLAAEPSGVVHPVLALAAAAEVLSRGDRAAAVRQLRAAPADSDLCAVLADTLDGRPLTAPPPDGSGEQAALVRIVHAAGVVESDPERCLELLSAAAADCDLTAVTDLARLLPALFAHAEDGGGSGGARKGGARKGGARKGGGRGSRPGVVRPPTEMIKQLSAQDPPLLDAAGLAACATAVGDYATAAELWERALGEAREDGDVRARYTRLLCHRAVTAHRTEDPLRSAQFLHRAAVVLPEAGPEPATERLPARESTAAFARGRELDTYAGRLLDQFFPGVEQGIIPWERPGRYAALEALIEGDAKLAHALRAAESTRIERRWADCLRTRAYDVRVHHTLALLYRETALGGPAPTARVGAHLARATVLWTLLLGSEGFWEQHGDEPSGPEAETRLRATVCRELFGTHRKRGAEALQAGDQDTARLHLRVLEAARAGASAVRDLLGEFGIPWSPAVDAGRWAEISALAGAVTDEWCAEVVQTAEKAVRDPAAIARLADGIDNDYESGIRALEPMIGLGIPLIRLLQTGLEWYNELQTCLYKMRRHEELKKVAGRARRFADALVPLCEPGKGHRPANSALGEHFVDRGLFVAGESNLAAVKFYEDALKWDPGNHSAPGLLKDARYRARLDRAFDELKANNHTRLLTTAEEAYGLASTDEDRAQCLVLQAMGHIGSGRISAARAVLERAMRLDPSDETARSLRDRLGG
ncbi:hypothetical protein [Streptomyces adelaidensis]|uniref:hypothetical protein n=1 Tax=Streptomyces adelaidensis TaxID=2796465 RepID=UPI001905AE16|nr:hypothetical protein [Streptomyces adelaidensis]